jgi:hypothetical protein
MERENSSAFDMKTLIHVGVEVLVVGAITFWFQKKSSSQQAEIEELRGKVEKMEEVLEAQNRLLMEHRNIFSNILGGRPPPPLQNNSQPRSPSQPPPSNAPRARPPDTTPNKKVPPRPPTPEEPSEEEEEIEEEEEEEEEVDMDELLKEELQSITVSPPLKKGKEPLTREALKKKNR